VRAVSVNSYGGPNHELPVGGINNFNGETLPVFKKLPSEHWPIITRIHFYGYYSGVDLNNSPTATIQIDRWAKFNQSVVWNLLWQWKLLKSLLVAIEQ
jgi:hypothetical protein